MALKVNNEKNNYLAIALGHLYGDGGITAKGRVHYCNSEDFLVKEFIDSMKFFKITLWIHRETNVVRIICPVSVGRKLWNLFGKFSFGKDTKIITKEIKNMPLKWKANMLQAWFNDDGSVVNYLSNYKVIAIKQKLKPLILFIKETLEELGINSKILNDDGKWLLRIMGYQNIKKFKEKINFSVGYRKNKQLPLLLQSIKKPHFITKNKILDSLKESPKTRKEIAKLLNMNSQVIYEHLHGRKRKIRKTNQELIGLGSVKCKKDGRINIYSAS